METNRMGLGPRLVTAVFVVVLASSIPGQVTTRVSLDSAGAQGNGDPFLPRISSDGRYVAFRSEASNLVPGDTNGSYDVYVRDRQLGTTERVSISTAGSQANNDSGRYGVAMSGDGRYVAFESFANNLVAGDTNGLYDIFVRDRLLGTTERVSLSSAGAQGDGSSGYDSKLSISTDGRYVSFRSTATNLVPGDTNALADIFVRDRQLGVTERVSLSSAGTQADGYSDDPAVSGDGRYVAFMSVATNLVPGDLNGISDIFVRDRQAATTESASVSAGGSQGNSFSNYPTISADGRYVAFQSQASNLVSGDTNSRQDVFVRDRQLGANERVSISTTGVQGNDDSYVPAISPDCRYVAFYSAATNLVIGDTNGTWDACVRDRQSGTTARVSLNSAGAEGDSYSYYPSITPDGRYVAFLSQATNLVPGDTNGFRDVFVRDSLGGTNFISLCNPGVSGVIACPCANPPGGSGRGCNNSSNTGGAIVTASGGTYLSSDSLVFTTTGEKPTALSIVAQWNGSNPSGVVFGMGVRCTSGTLKRLYNKAASGGSITAPDFGAGDLQVSVRSAALGDPIAGGQSRWYLVYYRDPIVLGGCPSTSTFNATQTGQVTWSP